MNGVLPSVTWGTWDLEGRVMATRSGNGGDVSFDQDSKKDRRRREKGVPPLKTQETAWFSELLHDRIEPLTLLHYLPNPLATTKALPSVIPWDRLPHGIHPKDGYLPPKRVQNKRHQVDNLAVFLQHLLRDGDRVVEFCAGSGYVALPLACLFPKCQFVLLDMKKPSLDIAHERIKAAGLTNVTVFCGKVDEYTDTFDVGIALHACGEATDMVLEKCLESTAAYVLAPCCVGKIKHSALAYPRSSILTNVLSRHEYEIVAKAADFGHTALTLTELNVARRRCKSVIEADRNLRARETKGYTTAMYIMHPVTATPKNDILVGWPSSFRHMEAPGRFLSDDAIKAALYGYVGLVSL
ncbi:hypothetical protein H310_11741 [Aphanomyces invadans]|uniref:Methyltransferase domain-containing protein n=1 Tax=Aphanomyces invadans TaxID=157072 RepID=A0A024TME1_9STRA|nr:hypothetical protein H310_11741 [Aphanomyces invadans]ETV94786.1 hypothetical protein H310_11741 [Aphanomyces invadans]|eukprot:XP_008876731.1 hypothetical protein H310_11741 [Aphanomyces invadans]